MKVGIYDPAMCCPTGPCGPNLDPVLVKHKRCAARIEKTGSSVERLNIAQEPKAFMANKTVSELIHKNGRKILPITLVNGEVFLTEEYPTYETLCEVLGDRSAKRKQTSKHNDWLSGV